MKTILSEDFLGKLIVTALILLSGCKNESTEPTSEHSFSGDAYGNIVLSNQHIMVVKNSLGSILITGQGSSNTCRWYLNKTVTTQLVSDTAALFSSINLSTQTSNDTLSVEVTSTAPSSVNPQCMIQLSIPYSVICKIERVSGDIEVDDLDSLLIIENASNVNVLRHNGSCQISTGTGNVSVASAFPDNGFCIVKVNKGDIVLKVPMSASAQVSVKSNNGTVSQTGLSLTSVQQQSNLLNGILGSGHGTIQLETNQGNIQIHGI